MIELFFAIIDLAMTDAQNGNVKAQEWLGSTDESPGSYLFYKELLRDLVFDDRDPAPHPPPFWLPVTDPVDPCTPSSLAQDYGPTLGEHVERRSVSGVSGVVADLAQVQAVKQLMEERDRARAGIAKRYKLTVEQYVERCRQQGYCCASCGANVQEVIVVTPGVDRAWLHFPFEALRQVGYCEDCL